MKSIRTAALGLSTEKTTPAPRQELLPGIDDFDDYDPLPSIHSQNSYSRKSPKYSTKEINIEFTFTFDDIDEFAAKQNLYPKAEIDYMDEAQIEKTATKLAEKELKDLIGATNYKKYDTYIDVNIYDNPIKVIVVLSEE